MPKAPHARQDYGGATVLRRSLRAGVVAAGDRLRRERGAMKLLRRWFGSSDDVSILPTRHKWPVDSELEKRRDDARAKLPENSVKAVHSWPVDANGSPIDYEDLPC